MSTAPRNHRKRRGFTKTELLIVMGIIATLIGLFAPVVVKQRERDARAQCMDNLKQIGLACHHFESNYKRLPPLYGGGPQGEKYATINNSLKFPTVWGSTHVFLLPYLEMESPYTRMATNNPPKYVPLEKDSLFKRMAIGDPPQYVPPQNEAVPTYVCPSDPSMYGGIVIGGTRGGSSYAANAQVFAPLASELITDGNMHPATKVNFTDRGSPLSRLADGTSNIVLFTHAYALCGSDNQGSAWSYSAGIGNPPSPENTFQPWSRASYLKQTYLTAPNAAAFQNQPNPYATKCAITDPATPHADAMIICLGDASVRTVPPNIAPLTWNRVCLPNDGDHDHDNGW
jgi:hypothetical protein